MRDVQASRAARLSFVKADSLYDSRAEWGSAIWRMELGEGGSTLSGLRTPS